MDRLTGGFWAKLVTDHVSEGIVLTDAHGDVIWVNPAFERLSGYTIEDMRGHRPGDILQGDGTTEASRRVLAEAIRTRTPCTTDIVNYRRDGSSYVSEISLRPIFDEAGAVSHFVAVQRDVSDQRRLAEESVDLHAYRRALDQQAIVSVTDARGRITFVNDNFCAISGYSRDELIGATHRIVNSGMHDRLFFREMWQAIRDGGSWHAEVCNRTKAGELYWVDTTIVPVTGPDGRVMRYVSTRYDITERKAAETELRRMAETDSLTGLSNRARFGTELWRLQADCAADPARPGGLIVVLDLDHFKDINDSMGHHMGDLLLKQIGHRLTELAGAGTVARLGGDEFGVLLPDDAGAEVGVALPSDDDRMRWLHAALSQAMMLGDSVYVPSFSMGVTRYPRDSETSEGLIIGADIALYEAKRAGRNRWCFFDPAVRERLDYRNMLKAALVDALEADRFVVVFQPIVSVQDGRHLGFEVLVRLTYEGQSLRPDHFIPLAEELGLIGAVSRCVMRKAAAAHRSFREAGLAPGFLALNIAAPQFREPGFVGEVQEFLLRHDMAPSDLLVEITETALIGRSTETVAGVLEALRALGIRVALDDFGTGFSSLSHLRDFGVDKIKIDRSFVMGLQSNPRDRDLVEGLVMLAHRIGLDIVAEGVETQAQLDFLRDVGVQQGQGYLFARPLDLAAARDWLARATDDRVRIAS
jgi:diguanylate cyclase (GGDEF)-like protein/PAS domain S-box-containing protein